MCACARSVLGLSHISVLTHLSAQEMCACARSVLGLSDVLKKLESLVADALSLVNLYANIVCI